MEDGEGEKHQTPNPKQQGNLKHQTCRLLPQFLSVVLRHCPKLVPEVETMAVKNEKTCKTKTKTLFPLFSPVTKGPA